MMIRNRLLSVVLAALLSLATVASVSADAYWESFNDSESSGFASESGFAWP